MQGSTSSLSSKTSSGVSTTEPQPDAPPTPDELTKGEKSLTDIILKCRRIPLPAYHFVVSLIAAAPMVWYACSAPDTAPLSELVRSISDMGMNISVTILGFLIAGFAIFATVTKPELFVDMAKKRHKKSGLSWLKYNLFGFVRVFFHYLIFLGLCILVKVFGTRGGPVSLLLAGPKDETERRVIAGIALALLSGYLVYVLLLLKTFIYDVYHVTVTNIRFVWDPPQ